PKGDRGIIYLPRIPEQIIAMLAVARLGAVDAVAYSAFSAQARRDRIDDAQAKAVIACAGAVYQGTLVEHTSVVDQAQQGNEAVEHVIVVRRTGTAIPWQAGRDVDWAELGATGADRHPVEPVDSEHPLFTLYTSGTTGKPKGVVHTHGGYMDGVYTTTRFVFDVKPDDIFWCTADTGRVTGHSYIVYGQLINGVTCDFYEGAPTCPEPGRFWSIVQRYGVTIFYTAPTANRGLMRHGDQWPARYDPSSLRH